MKEILLGLSLIMAAVAYFFLWGCILTLIAGDDISDVPTNAFISFIVHIVLLVLFLLAWAFGGLILGTI